jgi:hypothetical protein
MGYITAIEYNTLTGRPVAEATTIRINLASKLLDSRLGDYPLHTDGNKIDSSWRMYIRGYRVPINQAKRDAVKMWVAEMIAYLTDNNNKPAGIKNVTLGRFSVGNSNISSLSGGLPNELGYVDNILKDSGIINLRMRTL